MRISDWSSDVCSSDLERGKGDGSGGVLLPNFFRRIAMTLPLLRLAEIPDTAARENAERLYGVARALRDRLAVPQSVTRSLLKRLMTEAFGGSDADGRWSMRDAYDALEAAQASDTIAPDKIGRAHV